MNMFYLLAYDLFKNSHQQRFNQLQTNSWYTHCYAPSKGGTVAAVVVVVVVVVASVSVVGSTLPHPVTFHGWSQTLSSGLNTVPGAQGMTCKYPFEHFSQTWKYRCRKNAYYFYSNLTKHALIKLLYCQNNSMVFYEALYLYWRSHFRRTRLIIRKTRFITY